MAPGTTGSSAAGAHVDRAIVTDVMQAGFKVGTWEVFPSENRLRGPAGDRQLEPKVMNLLVYLASRPAVVVSRHELLDSVWTGTVVGDETLTRAISILRTQLGDTRSEPRYLRTVPKRGYQLIAAVGPLETGIGSVAEPNGRPVRSRRATVLAFALAIAALAIIWIVGSPWRTETGPDSKDTERDLQGPVSARSIAVLPFRNLSSLAEDANFIDGIHADILTSLVQLSTLDRVIARTSVEQYRDTAKPASQIGAELGVATVLEGTIQRAGDHVRITVRLIEAASDETLWSNHYDRALTAKNLFSIQSEISRAVADTMKIALSDSDRIRFDDVPTDSLDAYREFALGRSAMMKHTAADLEGAQAHFERAIELDPEYAHAYVRLADTLALQVQYANADRGATIPKRRFAIERALELDPQSGEAYTALAWLMMDQLQFTESEEYLDRALELSPHYADAHHWYAVYLRYHHRFEEVLHHSRRALYLDPAVPVHHTDVVIALWGLRRPDEARERLHASLERFPAFPDNHYLMINTLIDEGQLDQALQWAQAALLKIPDDRGLLRDVCNLYVQLGDELSAERCYDRFQALYPVTGWGHTVQLFRYRGNYAAAVETSRRLVASLPTNTFRVMLALDHLNNDQPGAARDILQGLAAEILDAGGPEFTEHHVWRAVVYACMLEYTGESGEADDLFERVLQAYPPGRRDRWPGFGTWDILAHAVRGQEQEAVAALAAAFDSGFRENWWWLRFPLFDPVRHNPQWTVLIAAIESDIARQRGRYESRRPELPF